MTIKHTAQNAISTRDRTDEIPSPFIFLKFNYKSEDDSTLRNNLPCKY